MDPNIQDWDHRVLRKPIAPGINAPKIAYTPSTIKTTYDKDNNEVVTLKIVSREMAQFIIKSRVEKKLKQVDLANRKHIDVKTIAEIERGGGIYNPAQVNKIAQILGVTIPRK
jgi:ribosome-binding protein aMBF1 (putative translation factor)